MSLQDLINRVSNINEQLGALRGSLNDSFNKLKSGEASDKMTRFQSELRDLKEEEAKYDSEFREEQNRVSAYGGKTRHQTLQEFVLLFFFVSFGLLTVTLCTFSYITTQSYKKSLLLFFVLILIGLLTSGIILRYA